MSLGPQALGQRTDVALIAALEQLGHSYTRSQLARAFAASDVRTAGKPVKPGRVVDGEVTLDVVLPRPEPLRAQPEALPLAVLHEDEHVLVVDKAAPMVVHAGPGHARGTLVNAVLGHLGVDVDALPVLPGNDVTRPGIVHRLDRDTSGVMVVAKTPRSQEALAAQFREHTIDREYVGVVEGDPSWEHQRVETGHGRDPRDRRRFAPAGERRAATQLTVEQRLTGAAVLGFRLETGRTHQIRMHARHLGHPVLGDELYGRPHRDTDVRAAVAKLGRHALHARRLGFEHPTGGGRVTFESPLPLDIAALIAKLS